MSAYPRSWFSKWLAPKRHRPIKRPFRPEVLSLEDRIQPSIYTVTTLAASGTGSLAAAITSANGNSGADTIAFDPSLFSGGPGTISITSTLTQITDSVTIDGPGSSVLTIDANHDARIFDITDSVRPVQVTLEGMTIQNGYEHQTGAGVNANGGGIRDLAGSTDTTDTLTISNCAITGCTAKAEGAGADANGGALYSSSVDVVISGTNVTANSALAQASAHGGGIYVTGPVESLTLANSHINSNIATGTTGAAVGGGVWAGIDDLTATNVQLESNQATGGTGGLAGAVAFGGGLFLNGATTATLTGATVSGNTVTGGNGYAAGSSVTTGTIVSGGGAAGGGLFADVEASSPSFTMTACTVDANVVNGGTASGPDGATVYGGFATDGGAYVVTDDLSANELQMGKAFDSTFADNQAIAGTATIRDSDITSSTGAPSYAAYGGIAETGGATISYMENDTIAGNTAQAGNGVVTGSGNTYSAVGGDAFGGGAGRGFYQPLDPIVSNHVIHNSTIAANTVQAGSGVDVTYSGSITTHAPAFGGGVEDANLALDASGHVAGIVTRAGTIGIYSTIVALDLVNPAFTSTPNATGPDIYGGYSLQFNWIGDSDASNSSAFPQGGASGTEVPLHNSNYDIVGPGLITGNPIDPGFVETSGVPVLTNNGGLFGHPQAVAGEKIAEQAAVRIPRDPGFRDD